MKNKEGFLEGHQSMVSRQEPLVAYAIPTIATATPHSLHPGTEKYFRKGSKHIAMEKFDKKLHQRRVQNTWTIIGIVYAISQAWNRSNI